MNRRDFIKGLGGGTGLFLAGCVPKRYIRNWMEGVLSDELYDFTDDLISDEAYKKIIDENMIIHAKHKYRTESSDVEHPQEIDGIGFMLNDRYLVTAKHVTVPNVLNYMTPFGMVGVPIKTIEDHAYLTEFEECCDMELEKIYASDEADLAMYELPAGFKKTTKLGDSDSLHIGHALAAIGNIYGEGKQISNGFVSSLKLPKGMKNMASGENIDNYVVFTNGIEPGCSGGGVYSFRDGEPELVGMGQLKLGRLGGILRINYIKEQLRKYL